MSINLKIFDLRCFVTLCDHKNFTKAAEEMCISQPPFSRIIQKLEFDMRGLLIDRTSKSFTLTPLGEKLLKSSKETVDSYDNFMGNIDLIRNPKSDELKIGFTDTASKISGFYELIDDLSHQASDVYLEELYSQSLCEKLKKGDIDVGILHFPLHLRSLKLHRINKCEAAVLFPKEICCFREKLSYKLILDEDKVDKHYNDYIIKKFPAYNLSPIYKKSTQLCPQLALQGQGILIYPESVARSINENNIFTLEIIEKSKDVFSLCIIAPKNPIKKITENIFKHF